MTASTLKRDMPSCSVSPKDLADDSLSHLRRMSEIVELGSIALNEAAENGVLQLEDRWVEAGRALKISLVRAKANVVDLRP
jgi:hypothetical protein